jgi:hypothetical protein
MATFEAGVEAWRGEVARRAGELDIDFCLAWIRKESAGSVCSTGLVGPGGFQKEAGIFQLFFEDANDVSFGTTSDEQLRACREGRRLFSQLTDDDKSTQVEPGLAMIRAFHDRAQKMLSDNGLSWGNRDTYKLTKLIHGLPAFTTPFVSALKPASWAEHRGNIESMSVEKMAKISAPAARFFTVRSRILANADFTGGFASDSPFNGELALYAIPIIGVFFKWLTGIFKVGV